MLTKFYKCDDENNKIIYSANTLIDQATVMCRINGCKPISDSAETYYIQLIKKGDGVLYSNNQLHCINKNSLIFINPGQDHEINMINPSSSDADTLLINNSLIQRFLTMIKNRQDFNLDNYKYIDTYNFEFSNIHLKSNHNLMELVNKCVHGEPDGFANDLFLEIVSQELLYTLLNNEIKSFLSTKTKASSNKEISRRIVTIIDYIRSNSSNDISLNTLADLVGLSKSYLIKTFKDETGVSPYHYLLNVRINKAKALLKSSKKSIKEIALELGFYDDSSFIKKFKQITGFTPNEFKYK